MGYGGTTELKTQTESEESSGYPESLCSDALKEQV